MYRKTRGAAPVFIFALVVCHAAGAQTVSYKDAVGIAAADIAAKIKAAERVAIIEFQTATGRFSGRVIDDLTDALITAGVRVVDRQNLDKIHAEQNYQGSGFVDDDAAVAMGHELGVSVIVLGSGENMADYCRFSFRVLSVETAEILTQSSINVRYDAAMRRLLNKKGTASGIGTTHFAAGFRLGAGFEMNSAHEDMVGEGYSPNEKSNTAFVGALYGAFRFSDVWSIQPEVNFMLNNGMEISGQGNSIKIDYPTLDIPLLLRWNFMQAPVLVGIMAGPYISVPAGKLNLSVDGKGSALDTRGRAFGVAGGFTLGLALGPGFLTADARCLNDFDSLYVREDFGEGIEDAKICIRRSVNVTVGYEFVL